MMKGILMKSEVWKAKLAVLKQYGEAQTRRVEKSLEEVNKAPDDWVLIGRFDFSNKHKFCAPIKVKPRYHVGEIVYVKEAHYLYGRYILTDKLTKSDKTKWEFRRVNSDIIYLFNTNRTAIYKPSKEKTGWHLRSPLFMFEKDARYHLEITKVRLERLHDIADEDCVKEGTTVRDFYPVKTASLIDYNPLPDAYCELFYSINPQYKDKNPWLLVYDFKLVEIVK